MEVIDKSRGITEAKQNRSGVTGGMLICEKIQN